MQRICWRQLDINGKEGPLFGSGWGLSTTGSKDIKSYCEMIVLGISANRQPGNFWLCEEDACGSLLEHIWTPEDVRKLGKKGYRK
jgi:hypothetical protein